MTAATHRAGVLRRQRSVLLDAIALLLAASFSLSCPSHCAHAAQVAQVTLDCSPCVVRSGKHIRVIVHGTKSSEFWQRVQVAAAQAGLDMGVAFEMSLYDTFDPSTMAADIIDSVTQDPDNPPDALVVSIPSQEVADAVQTISAKVPVFGLNSGGDVAADLGVLGFVAMDEYVGGIAAANAFVKSAASASSVDDEDGGDGDEGVDGGTSIAWALYINREKGNSALELRRDGFTDRLTEINPDVQIDELVVDMGASSPDEISARIDAEAFEGCPYDAVLLSGTATLGYATSASTRNGCNVVVGGNTTRSTMIGTFDVNSQVYLDIAFNRIVFGIGQQNYLQGALPVVMASIYVTTGQRLAPSAASSYGLYMSGPRVIDRDSYPTDTQVVCQSEAFPVCSADMDAIYADAGMTPSSPQCACTDRSKISVAGVLHGVTTDAFWDPVFAAAEQAAKDMGVTLELNRFEPEEDESEIYAKMATQIEKFCGEEGTVDGLFITIPSDQVVDAIRQCQERNIPVVSVNTGAEVSRELGLMDHIGQLEYNAGKAAGLRLVELAPEITKAFCLNHAPGLSSTVGRCDGFQEAIESLEGVDYGGVVEVPQVGNADLFKSIAVEEAVGEEGDWVGIGMLLLGPSAFSAALDLHAAHPAVKMGTFDVFPELDAALQNGTVLFGIDQNSYLQGYFPVNLLTYKAYTGQQLVNDVIETGPGFIESPANEAEQICQANFYKVCESSPSTSTAAPTPTTDVPVPAPTMADGDAPTTTLAPSGATTRASYPSGLLLVALGAIVYAWVV